MKLLRKVRRKLLDKGKIKSYLLYALGEVVLIVIAVSIAWKINDLNDTRKSKIAEHKIFVNLNGELQTNLNLLKGLIAETTQTINTLENTLNYVGTDPKKLTEGAKDTIIHILDKELSIIDSSIHSIVSTNKLERIDNNELKELIIMYPTRIQNCREQDSKIKSIVANRLKPTIEKHISLTEMLPNTDKKYAHIKKYGTKSNYGALLQDLEYQNSIVDRLLQTKIQLHNLKTLQGKTNILIYKLNEELN